MSKSVFYFGEGQAEGDPKRRDLLGGKGAGLAEMTSLGLPVPAGVTLSTELCNALLLANRSIKDDAAVKETVLAAIARVEKAQGAKLGDPANPLLVSVRSGARASMPGMMDTILNLGMNDAVAEGMSKKTDSPRFAYDAYRRFLAMYSDVAPPPNGPAWAGAATAKRTMLSAAAPARVRLVHDPPRRPFEKRARRKNFAMLPLPPRFLREAR